LRRHTPLLYCADLPGHTASGVYAWRSYFIVHRSRVDHWTDRSVWRRGRPRSRGGTQIRCVPFTSEFRLSHLSPRDRTPPPGRPDSSRHPEVQVRAL